MTQEQEQNTEIEAQKIEEPEKVIFEEEELEQKDIPSTATSPSIDVDRLALQVANILESKLKPAEKELEETDDLDLDSKIEKKLKAKEEKENFNKNLERQILQEQQEAVAEWDNYAARLEKKLEGIDLDDEVNKLKFEQLKIYKKTLVAEITNRNLLNEGRPFLNRDDVKIIMKHHSEKAKELFDGIEKIRKPSVEKNLSPAGKGSNHAEAPSLESLKVKIEEKQKEYFDKKEKGHKFSDQELAEYERVFEEARLR